MESENKYVPRRNIILRKEVWNVGTKLTNNIMDKIT
jgi:hypothetical protein